jgi:hypothetical protein
MKIKIVAHRINRQLHVALRLVRVMLRDKNQFQNESPAYRQRIFSLCRRRTGGSDVHFVVHGQQRKICPDLYQHGEPDGRHYQQHLE